MLVNGNAQTKRLMGFMDSIVEERPVRIGSKGPGEVLESELRRLLDAGNPVRIELLGYSLFPVVMPHSTLVVVADHVPNKGDLVVLVRPAGLAAHFVVDIADTAVLTRGVWVLHDDGWTPTTNVLGLVVEVRFGPVHIDTVSAAFRAAVMSAIAMSQRYPQRFDKKRIALAGQIGERQRWPIKIVRKTARFIADFGRGGGRHG